MRRAAYILGFLAMVSGALWMMGCGGADLLDVLNDKYTVSLLAHDGGETRQTIDMWALDCNASNDANETAEEFTDIFGDVTFVAEDGAPAVRYINRYTVEYVPMRSNIAGAIYWPPDLEYFEWLDTVPVGPNGTTEYQLFLGTVYGTKNEYLTKMCDWENLNPSTPCDSTDDVDLLHIACTYESSYSIKLTLYFTDMEYKDHVQVAYEDVVFTNYIN